MKTSRKRTLLLPLLLSGALVFSCVSQKKPAFEPLLSHSRQYYGAGEFQKAIDSYNAGLKKYPEEKIIQKEYIKTLEEIKLLADKTLDKKDFISAEKVYSVLQKNYPQLKPVEKFLSFTPQLLSQRIRDCRIGQKERQARQLLQAGDFQKALDLYKAAYEEYNSDISLSADLRKTMEDVKRLADEALAKEDFIPAGKAYSALRTNYPFYEKVAQLPAFSSGSLEEGLKKCRTQLTQKGLERYRKGKLGEAISFWQGILLFDPDNVEIKKAIDTATEQLKKLKKK